MLASFFEAGRFRAVSGPGTLTERSGEETKIEQKDGVQVSNRRVSGGRKRGIGPTWPPNPGEQDGIGRPPSALTP
eukprot:6852401-Pyramimonas_sp.AAC.1